MSTKLIGRDPTRENPGSQDMNVIRTALAVCVALFSVGCDDAYTDAGLCLPTAGCDGIIDIAEVDFEPAASQLRSDEQPAWCDESDDTTYVAQTRDACDSIIIHCEPGWVNFDNECGCGCKYVGGVPIRQQPRPDGFRTNGS